MERDLSITFLSIMEIPFWLAFLGGSGVTAILVSIFNNLTSFKVAREERGFAFSKEEYAIFRNNASKIFGYIYDNENKLKQMHMQMSIGMTDLSFIKKDEENLEKIKRSIFEIIHIYFPELRDAHDEYSIPTKKAMRAYFKAIRSKVLTEEIIEEFKSALEDLDSKRKSFIDHILQVLSKKKEELSV